jgi:hypothetical protein
MSLRMNLYGWSFGAFRKTIGGGDEAVLEKATAGLSEALKEPQLSRGLAWLQTLIQKGYPFRDEPAPYSPPDDGGLVTVLAETETHAVVVHSIVKAIAQPDPLDLVSKSSLWVHECVASLHKEIRACEFNRSKACPRNYLRWIMKLSNGTPFFGDEFRTAWTFYTAFRNEELEPLIAFLRAAAEYTRVFPEKFLEEMKSKVSPSLSEGGKRFTGDLAGMFDQIRTVGQDAYIVWW